MNRTLKFRAWDKEKKQMCIVNAIQFKAGLVLLVRNDGKQYAVPLSNVELLQFTYAHDKNGKEIFERDIIKIAYPMSKSGKNEEVDSLHFFCYDEDGCATRLEGCEVIGNVFENPELISSTEPSPTLNPIEAPQKSDPAPK